MDASGFGKADLLVYLRKHELAVVSTRAAHGLISEFRWDES